MSLPVIEDDDLPEDLYHYTTAGVTFYLTGARHFAH
jgi:hypothetical protein